MAPSLGFNINLDPIGQLPGTPMQRPDGTSFTVPPAFSPVQPPVISPPRSRDPFAIQAQAANDQMAAAAAQINAQGEAQNRAIDSKTALYKDEAGAQEEAFRGHQERQATLQKASDDIIARTRAWANTNIDPNAVTARMDTWQKVALGISLAAGGFMAPYTRGENMALKSLNTIIDRDMQAQEANLKRQGVALEMEGQANRQGMNNERVMSAELLEHRAKLLGMAEKQVDLEASRATTPGAQAKLLEMKAAFEKEMADTATKLAIVREQQGPEYARIKENARQFNTMLPLKGHELGVEGAARMMTSSAKEKGESEVLSDPATGKVIASVPKQEAKRAREVMREYQAAKDLIAKLRKGEEARSVWENRPDFLNLGSAARQAAFSDHAALVSTFRRIIGTGAQFSKNEEQNINRQIGEKPSGWFEGSITNRLDEAEKNLDAMIGNYVRGLNTDGNYSGSVAPPTSTSTSGEMKKWSF